MLRFIVPLFVIIAIGISNAHHTKPNIGQWLSEKELVPYHVVATSKTRAVSHAAIGKRNPDTTASHVASIPLEKSLTNQNVATLDVDGQQIQMACVRCTLDGLLHAKVTDLSWKSDVFEKNFGFNGGHVTANLPQGLKGHFEFGLALPSSFSGTADLLKTPIFGVAIPGLTNAGVLVSIGIPISIQLEKGARLTFGFQFELPIDSHIKIDAADPHNSSVHGFKHKENMVFNLLPVNISEPDLDVQITTGLEFDITLGAEVLGDDIDAEIGARLRLPEITIDERQLSNVDGKCNPLKQQSTKATSSSASTEGFQPRATLEQLVGKFTNIVPCIDLDFGVFMMAGLKDSIVGKDVKLLESTTAQIFTTSFPLPTTCINNHNADSTAPQSSSSIWNGRQIKVTTAEFIQIPSITKQTSEASSSVATTSSAPTSAAITSSTTKSASISSAASISTTSRSIVPAVPQNSAFSAGSNTALALAIALGLLVASS